MPTAGDKMRVLGVANMDGAGSADIVLEDSTDGRLIVWYMDGTSRRASEPSKYISYWNDPQTLWVDSPRPCSNGWTVVGIANFDDQGTPDILWQNTKPGDNDRGKLKIWHLVKDGPNKDGTGNAWFDAEWVMNGGQQLVVNPADYSVEAVGRFNTGSPDPVDFLARRLEMYGNTDLGKLDVFKLNDGSYQQTYSAVGQETDPDWRVVTSADMDGDGVQDLIWQNRRTGAGRVERMRMLNGVMSSKAQRDIYDLPTAPISMPVKPLALPEYSNGSPNGIKLTWTQVEQTETGFEIQRSTSTDFSNPTTWTRDPNTTGFHDTTAQANTDYYYRVRAVRTGGNADSSAWATIGNAVKAKTPNKTITPATASSVLSGLQAGDVVLVTNDTYTSQWIINSAGTAANPIRFVAQTDGGVLFDGVRLRVAQSNVHVRGFAVQDYVD